MKKFFLGIIFLISTQLYSINFYPDITEDTTITLARKDITEIYFSSFLPTNAYILSTKFYYMNNLEIYLQSLYIPEYPKLFPFILYKSEDVNLRIFLGQTVPYIYNGNVVGVRSLPRLVGYNPPFPPSPSMSLLKPDINKILDTDLDGTDDRKPFLMLEYNKINMLVGLNISNNIGISSVFSFINLFDYIKAGIGFSGDDIHNFCFTVYMGEKNENYQYGLETSFANTNFALSLNVYLSNLFVWTGVAQKNFYINTSRTFWENTSNEIFLVSGVNIPLNCYFSLQSLVGISGDTDLKSFSIRQRNNIIFNTKYLDVLFSQYIHLDTGRKLQYAKIDLFVSKLFRISETPVRVGNRTSFPINFDIGFKGIAINFLDYLYIYILGERIEGVVRFGYSQSVSEVYVWDDISEWKEDIIKLKGKNFFLQFLHSIDLSGKEIKALLGGIVISDIVKGSWVYRGFLGINILFL